MNYKISRFNWNTVQRNAKMAGVPFHSNLIIGILEVPFFFILMVLGVAAYFKNKNMAVKYAIILFPVVMTLNLLAFLVGSIRPFYYELVETLNPTFVFVVFIVCSTAFILGMRWYIKNKGPIILYLVISFGLCALSSLLMFLYDHTFINKYIVILVMAFITGMATYITGISAMILALIRPKPRLADGGV
jgi:hypothetical protein